MPCNCHPLGSASNECDEAGQCQCLPGVTGQLCDQCRSGFFGLSRTGCRGQSMGQQLQQNMSYHCCTVEPPKAHSPPKSYNFFMELIIPLKNFLQGTNFAGPDIIICPFLSAVPLC